jgi:peptidoglycan/xylan/chitin deacetylase (PgdA/CDA1 family)
MNLVAFSIRTKGIHNFARRLWTVFSRFGFSEKRTRRALYSIINTVGEYRSAPTFFIPAVVLNRHPQLIAELSRGGTEVGIHGYVHNDYRFLAEEEQYRQTNRAISVFERVQVPFYGFRNPYLGWNDASLRVFAALKFAYESNEAVLHDVIDIDALSPLIRSGYEKSLTLFQAIPCNAYTLRPRLEGELVRIPTSIPDDEMLFDRLRITEPKEVGKIWSDVMQRVYDLGGIYTLNLHPERGVLCQQALSFLLSHADATLKKVWITRLQDVARWWKERRQFSFQITLLADQQWQVEVDCTPEATILGRHLFFEEQQLDAPATSSWSDNVVRIESQRFALHASHIPCIGLSQQSHQEVADFLSEQGYAYMRCLPEEASRFSHYIDLPQGLQKSPIERREQCSMLVQEIEGLEAPLLCFGCWPNGNRAALAVSGDIDSVTIQDFFLRIVEVSQR